MKTDDTLRDAIIDSHRQIAASAPEFDATWAAATERAAVGRSIRGWRVAAIAAALLPVAMGVSLLLPQTGSNERQQTTSMSIDTDMLFGSTQWVAPSDALLPSREFDMYRDLPRLIESTQARKGALL